jgi:hypothetical protein
LTEITRRTQVRDGQATATNAYLTAKLCPLTTEDDTQAGTTPPAEIRQIPALVGNFALVLIVDNR